MSIGRQRRYRRRVWLTGCLVLAVGLVLVLAVSVYLLLLPTDDGTAALRAKGYPTTLAELDALYPEPPVGENAAEYYVQAGGILNDSTYPDLFWLPMFGKGELPPLGTPIFEYMLTEISAFLDYESLAFELIDEASEFEHSRDPAHDQTGASSFREMLKALQGQYLRTRYFNSRSDAIATLEQLSRLVHLTHSQAQVPVADGLMGFTNSVARTVSAIEFIMNENDLTHDQLNEIDVMLEQLLVEDALVNNIVAMRCRTLNIMDSPQSFSIFSGLARKNLTDIADEYLEVAEGGLPDELGAFRALLNHEFSLLEFYAAAFSGPLHSAVLNFYKAQARIDTARMAIAIQQLRLDGAALPNDWASMPETLKERWLIDPFTGRPLRYKRIDDGYIVYSAGRNFIDDGGDASTGGDIVFRVLR